MEWYLQINENKCVLKKISTDESLIYKSLYKEIWIKKFYKKILLLDHKSLICGNFLIWILNQHLLKYFWKWISNM